MKKDAKDKKFFNLKKASSDTEINETVNEVEAMSPSEDIPSENTKKKKGLDFSKFRRKKKERKQQVEEGLNEVKAKGEKVKKDLEKAQCQTEEGLQSEIWYFRSSQ